MGIRGRVRRGYGCALALAMLFSPTLAAAADPVTLKTLEQQAQSAFVAGRYGAADEKIRAAIGLAQNDDFNRLALLQGLIATRMGSDGRSLLGAAIAAHDSAAWPRPIISYILGERKLQDVADAERRSGNNMLVKRQHICELTFYAGAFALADAQTRFARQLFEKADQACDSSSPLRAMIDVERAALAKP